jgi:hypothetical protein
MKFDRNLVGRCSDPVGSDNRIPTDRNRQFQSGFLTGVIGFLSVGIRLSDPTGSLHVPARLLSNIIGFCRNPMTGSVRLGIIATSTMKSYEISHSFSRFLGVSEP